MAIAAAHHGNSALSIAALGWRIISLIGMRGVIERSRHRLA